MMTLIKCHQLWSTNHIFSTKNSLDFPIPVNEKWIKQNDLFYTNENKTTKYEVYVLHSNIPIMYKEILLKRKNS